MGPPVAVATVVDTVTYKLGLKQCSVLAPHPFLNPLAPDRSGNGKGGTDASPTGPSVFYVCRMSDMQVDMLKELLPFSFPMTGSSSSLSSSTSSASSSHVYEIGVRHTHHLTLLALTTVVAELEIHFVICFIRRR
jgi:hypothetical protein